MEIQNPSEFHENENSEKEEKHRRRRKRQQKVEDEHEPSQPTTTGSYVPRQYLQFPADILTADTEESDETNNRTGTGPQPTQTDVVSQPTPSVFVQQSAGFRKTQREQVLELLAQRKKEVDYGDSWDAPLINTIQSGVFCQKIFHTVAVILQGFIAGFAFFHCLLVFLFTSSFYHNNIQFVEMYARLALPTHIFCYVGLVLCAVAVLDRYDIGQSFLRVVHKAVTFRSGGLAVVAYLVAVVMSLMSFPVEERMNLYIYHNKTHLLLAENGLIEQPWLSTDMDFWKITLTVRAVAVLSAWLLVATRPGTDLLQKHMIQAEEQFVAFKQNSLPADSKP